MDETKYPVLHRVLGMPKRPRHKAADALNGKLPLQIAEHLFKILCLPQGSRNHWVSETKEFFQQLLFSVSKKTQRDFVTKQRIIKEVHFEATSVQRTINDLSADAAEILDNYPPDQIHLPPPDHTLEGNLTDYGFRIQQYLHPEQGIQWKVFLQGKELLDTVR